MQLTYRGVKYDYTPPATATTSSDLAAQYDGIDVRFRNHHKPLVQPTTVDLKYRGVAYTTEAEQQARAWEIEREHNHENRQLSMLGRLRSELSV